MHQNIWPPYWTMQENGDRLKIIKTKGSFIYDDAGNKIFDGISSWWSVCHGYNHPLIVKSMRNCLAKMSHVMFAGITHDYAEILAEKLHEFSFGRFHRTFFCDSGSVATEVAVKMALQYWQEKKVSDKKYILTFEGCYHGETFMAAGLSSDETSYLANYTNNILNVKIPSNKEELKDLDSFLSKNYKHIACSILEPLVQGAAGIKMYSHEILRDIFDLIKKYDILFIVDECAMGFYRTGRRFAFDHSEIAPDIVTLGKALSGGHIGLAAVCASNEIFETICKNGYFRHGPTFMANPLACSAGIASLDIFSQSNYAVHIKSIHDIFENLRKTLKEKLGVQGRTLGAIFAVEIEPNCKLKDYIIKNISKHKLWVRPLNNTLYLMPPLNVDLEHLLVAVHNFEQIIKNTHSI